MIFLQPVQKLEVPPFAWYLYFREHSPALPRAMFRFLFLLLAFPILGPVWVLRILLFRRYGLAHRPFSGRRLLAILALRPHRSRWP